MTNIRGFYFITDSSLSRKGVLYDAALAMKQGCKILQYREKEKSTAEMISIAKELREICKDCFFIVNDRIDVALASKADGVHIGSDDMDLEDARSIYKNGIIGRSVRNVEQAVAAEKAGADYLGLGPIYITYTKPNLPEPLGVEMILRVKTRVSIPVIAIGGINLMNLDDVLRAGTDGVASISCVYQNLDDNLKRFIEKCNR